MQYMILHHLEMEFKFVKILKISKVGCWSNFYSYFLPSHSYTFLKGENNALAEL